jgi:hypothetical protein
LLSAKRASGEPVSEVSQDLKDEYSENFCSKNTPQNVKKANIISAVIRPKNSVFFLVEKDNAS